MKHWTTRFLILLLFVTAVFSAYNYFNKPFLKNSTENLVSEVEPSTVPTPSKIPKKELNTKEKIAQLLAVPLDVNSLTEESTSSAKMMSFIKENNPGFVIYFGEKISTTSAILATKTIRDSFAENSYIPLIAVDHEGGSVQRLSGEGFTRLESWQKVVSTYSSVQQKAVFNQSATELYSVGVNIVFAPVVDLASRSAVLKTRAAADSGQVFATTVNFIYSFSQNGIMPVLKHFPGIGSIPRDPHNGVSTINLSEDDVSIFSQILNKFANIGVMTAHVRLEDKLSGKVCSLSTECLGPFEKSYPNVLLFTDGLTMKAALAQIGSTQEKDIEKVAIEAIEAGNNVLVFGNGVEPVVLEKTIFALQKEYEDSESFRKKVDYSVAKIISLKK